MNFLKLLLSHKILFPYFWDTKNDIQSFSIHLCSTNSSLAYISVSNYAYHTSKMPKSILRRLKIYFIFPLNIDWVFYRKFEILNIAILMWFLVQFLLQKIYFIQDDATFVWSGNSKLIYGKFQNYGWEMRILCRLFN